MDPNAPFDYLGFASVFAFLALLALPLAVSCGVLAGAPKHWLRPRWAFPARTWNGFAIAGIFIGYQALLPLANAVFAKVGFYANLEPAAAITLRTNLSRLIVTPTLIVGATAFAAARFGIPRWPGLRPIAGWIALGIVAWLGLATATFAVNISALAVQKEVGGAIDQHPLMLVAPQSDGTGGLLFALSVCVFTPWFEEYFFRGLILPWVQRAWSSPAVLVGWSLLFAGLTMGSPTAKDAAPVLFVLVFALVLLGIQKYVSPRRRRTTLALVSSSLLFAAVHSQVWPTPVPLFVLGLGLGYLTLRTGSIVPAVVVHGLFNGVSFLWLLRSHG